MPFEPIDPRPRAVALNKPTEVLLFQPKERPQALLAALATLFGAHREVSEARFAHIAYPGEPPHAIVGVQTSGAWDALTAEIGRLIDRIRPDLTVDLVPLADDDTGLSQALLNYPPFYSHEGTTP